MATKPWPAGLVGPPVQPGQGYSGGRGVGTMAQQAAQQAQGANPNPIPDRQSNLRFRSFCERYFVTRSEFFRKDPDGLQEDMWQCILDAKRVYKMIGQVGLNVED